MTTTVTAAPPIIPEGFLGNLTPEQETMLKQMWTRFLDVSEKGAAAFDAYKPPNKAAATDMEVSCKVVKELGAEKFRDAFWRSPSADHPDNVFLRFLRARKWDFEKSFAMFANMIKYRVDFDVDGIVDKGEERLNVELKNFDLQMKAGKSYLHGSDRLNRPISWIHVRVHDPKQQEWEVLRAFTIYCMEASRPFLTPPSNQCTLVFDMSDFGLKNMDWSFVRFIVEIFEAYYPETLGSAIIHRAPWIFSGIWRAIQPLLDPVIKQKVHFTKNETDLFEFIDPDHMPKSMGGNEDWTWEYTDCIEGENARYHDKDAKAEWITKRTAARGLAIEKTQAWAALEDSNDDVVRKARDQAILQYRITSLQADPWLRPRSVYHRQGNLPEDGTIVWDYQSPAGKQTFGVPLGELQAMLAKGDAPPEPGLQKAEGELALSSPVADD